MALVDALDGMSTCVSNGPEWLMLQLTFWWTIKNAAGFQATAARGVFKSALQPQGDGAALDADWSLTGVVWTSGLAFHPFLSLSRGNLRDRYVCCNSSRVFGQNPWATDENTRLASWWPRTGRRHGWRWTGRWSISIIPLPCPFPSIFIWPGAP